MKSMMKSYCIWILIELFVYSLVVIFGRLLWANDLGKQLLMGMIAHSLIYVQILKGTKEWMNSELSAANRTRSS